MIDLQHVSLQFTGEYLFSDVSFRINAGDRYSLVGANGTGKSSLMKIITGDLVPESGQINMQRGISIGYLPQDNVTHSGRTLLDEASTALSDIRQLEEREQSLTDRLRDETIGDESLDDETRNDLVNQLGEVHHRLEELGSYGAEANVKKILGGLGFKETDFHRLTDEFSGGWQMRIALAKLLISNNDLLMLDEPTNHLDLDSLRWLIDFLKSYRGALLIVSHDKYFINTVTDKTLEIFLRKFNVYHGKFDDYLEYKKEREEQLEHQYEQQQKKIKETTRFIERFRYKNTKAKQVQSRVKQLEKMELVELPDQQSVINLAFPEAPRSGRINVELQGIHKAYGDNVIFDDFDFALERGEKIAFVGPNGAGKTTLSKIIADEIPVDKGERIIGHKTWIAYYAQDVTESLNPENDLLDSLEEIAPDKKVNELRTILGSFLFTGDDVFKKTGVLSGGEKSRVALARILLTRSNVLILDEPTNHLDYSSKRILQKALMEFQGSMILVSHDIDFLRPVVNKVVEILPGRTKIYPGTLDYYLQKKEEEEAALREEKPKEQQISNRREQKRLEAEIRKERHAKTKELKKEVSQLEEAIARLEERIEALEVELADEAVFSRPALAKEKNAEYAGLQKELEGKMARWEMQGEKLMELEEEFNQRLGQ